jgi:segregation and condensation protein B
MADNIGKKPEELTFDVNALPGGLKSAIEAILIVCSEPQSSKKLANTLAVSEQKVLKALEQLKVEYETDQRGFELLSLNGLWRFYSATAFGEVINSHIKGSTTQRLSVAALETLAIIAYRQPISRAEIASIRGVNVDGVLRTLLQRDLVDESKEKSESGAGKYETTTVFLEKLGLNSLDDLEPLAPFLPTQTDDIPEFEDIRKTKTDAKNKSTKEESNDE